MRKFKFMSKAVVGMMSAAMAMGSLSGIALRQPIGVYAAASTIVIKNGENTVADQSTLTIKQGGNLTLSATAVDNDTNEDEGVEWEIGTLSGNSITSVPGLTVQDGVITVGETVPVANYTLKITAKATDTLTSSITIMVRTKPTISDVTITTDTSGITIAENKTSVKRGTDITFTGTVAGNDTVTEDTTVTWSLSKPSDVTSADSAVTLSQEGVMQIACNAIPGKYTVTATSDCDSSKKASVEVTIEEDDLKYTSPLSFIVGTEVKKENAAIPTLPTGYEATGDYSIVKDANDDLFGLTFDQKTGAIYGTPTSAGNKIYKVTVQAQKGSDKAETLSGYVQIDATEAHTTKITLNPSGDKLTIKQGKSQYFNIKEFLNPNEELSFTALTENGDSIKGVNISESGCLTVNEDVPVNTKITVTASINGTDVSDSAIVTVIAPTVSTVKSLEIHGNDIVGKIFNEEYTVSIVYDQKGDNDPEITWEVSGQTDKDNTKMSRSTGEISELVIGRDEKSTKLTITAKSGTVNNTMEVIIADAARLNVSYDNALPFRIDSTNRKDSFLFLDVVKTNSLTEKASATYCYKGSSVSIDPSALKLTKGGYVRVYGDVNTTPAKVYQISAQIKKPSVKYVTGKDTFLESFQYAKAALTEAKAANLEWKLPTSSSWLNFSELECCMPSLTVAGSTLLIREVSADNSAMPSAEVKVKISASPKAPKVTLDYAKNTVKLTKNSMICVPTWEEIPTKELKDEDGNVYEIQTTPFYYTVGTDKTALNPEPANLAKDLVAAYVKAMNDAANKLTDADWKAEYTITTEPTYVKDEAGKDTTEIDIPAGDAELLAEMMENGYQFLLYTKSNKGTSQPAFVNVKAAPEIQVQKKNTAGANEEPVWVEENKIAVMTTEVDKDGKVVEKYSSNTLTFTWSEDNGLTLTPAGNVSFAYSLDNGKKFTTLKKTTSIKLSKITDKTNGVLVRTAGTKENAKQNIVGDWASNTIKVPVAISEVKVTGKDAITADATKNMTETYTAEAKDFFDATIKDGITWTATGTVEDKIIFDETAHTLTVKPDATDATVTITATCGSAKGTFEVKVKAAEKTNSSVTDSVTKIEVSAKNGSDSVDGKTPISKDVTSLTFEADVTVTGNAAKTVTWSVADKNTTTGALTSSINATSGVLTIDHTSDAGKTLVITATSTVDAKQVGTFEIQLEDGKNQ